MTENNGNDLIATAASGRCHGHGRHRFACRRPLPSRRAGLDLRRVHRAGAVPARDGWQLAGTPSRSPRPSATNGGPVELCQATTSIEMHGALTALANSAGQARTVNTLPLEQYVADVAPSESPSTWAALGGRRAPG